MQDVYQNVLLRTLLQNFLIRLVYIIRQSIDSFHENIFRGVYIAFKLIENSRDP